MTISARLKTFLDASRVRYTWLTHPVTYTAQAAAASLHVSGKEVAKTVVLRAGEETLLAVLPASHHVDLEKIGRLVGKSLRLASEQEFRELFPDCELGAIPPFGQLYNLPVYVDESLAADEEIVFSGGTHHDAVRMRYADFARLTNFRASSFAAKG
jgi:Ala-tRNA(Pro) deacylase